MQTKQKSYIKFIPNFANIAQPLNTLRKYVTFVWNVNSQNHLKITDLVTSPPILDIQILQIKKNI